MIGVLADPSDQAVIHEFFELFKTPWELYRGDRRYEVILCTGARRPAQDTAQLTLLYSGNDTLFDVAEATRVSGDAQNGRMFRYGQTSIPIYGERVVFKGRDSGFLVDPETGWSAGYLEACGDRTIARIGYDLFHEVRALLTAGQPACHSAIPALDIHIALLRDLIQRSGVQLVEIPPVPKGYKFIACLTHDVDHPSISRHRFDHTMLGFLYRAVFRSFVDTLQGRTSVRKLARNWMAAVKLPLVYLGLAEDFWQRFDRYPEVERGRRSTFFVIPFRNYAGSHASGSAPKHRAAAYGAADITEQIQLLRSKGCEIGLHGIDAWRDRLKAGEELQEVRRLTGMGEIGVRMHWLYFDQDAPAVLEEAGADYDSTVGYNGTVGYRAGTTQVYKPLQTTRLLELPLHIMDTALFYPSHLNLTFREATKRVLGVIDNAAQFGGVVTVNWHDRSIAPERCWDDFYKDLLNHLDGRGAWFATAAETVAWFRKRRDMTFHGFETASGTQDNAMDDIRPDLPGCEIRVSVGLTGVRDNVAFACEEGRGERTASLQGKLREVLSD